MTVPLIFCILRILQPVNPVLLTFIHIGIMNSWKDATKKEKDPVWKPYSTPSLYQIQKCYVFQIFYRVEEFYSAHEKNWVLKEVG